MVKRDFLVLGYKAGILLSFAGIIASAVYLFAFLRMSPGTATDEIQLLSQTAERRLLLLSTGIFVGMSFGFLGFALFLIQAKGDLDLEGSVQDYKLKMARVSPGLFVILCATAIIIVCATFPIEYEMKGAAKKSEAAIGPADRPHVSPEGLELTPEASRRSK